MKSTLQGTLSTILRHDLPASIVVFLVALPLCMGIAIASGAPVAAGLLTGIVGGLVVALLAGAPLQVSGPAAGLTVIVYDVIQRHGLEALGLVVLIAGLMQVAAGACGLAQWFRAVSPAVIKGMLSGIGVLIFASQFHVMVDDAPKGGGLQNLVTIPQAVGKTLEVPTLSDRESRAFRTRMLRELGEVHRRQSDLNASVQRLVPAAGEPAETTSAAAEDRVDVAALQQLTSQQIAIQDRLKELTERLQGYHPHPNGEQTRSLQQAADAALAAVQAAVVQLQEGDIRAVLASQESAADSLAALQASLKQHSVAAQIGLLTILLIIAWQALAPKRLKFIPAPLVAALVATGIAAAMYLPVLYVVVPDNLLDAVTLPTAGVIQDADWGAVLQSALIIAVVASAETLLCAVAVDQMHEGPRTRFGRELVAQGVGNTVCGFLGALPMTGVIVRSSANVQAGARTRWSAFLHGVWLLIFVALLAAILRLVPTATLAAILVYTGYKLMNFKAIPELWRYGRGEVLIFAATVGVIVVQDLLTGIITGVVLSGIKLLYTFSHLKVRLKFEEEHRATLSMEGSATFIRLPRLAERLEQVPANTELHVDLSHLDYIDHACLDLLMSWAKQHEATGGKLVVDWETMHARFRREPPHHLVRSNRPTSALAASADER